MAAAAPLPTPPTGPAAPTVPAPRTGALRDTGAVRRDSIRAATWTSTGTAKVQGDVDVGNGTVTGLATVGGKLSADSFRSRGTLEVVGRTEVREMLTVEGTVHFRAGVRAGSLDSDGTVRCPADIQVDRAFRVTGTVEAPTVRVGEFQLLGTAEIVGDLDAVVSVRARFRGDSAVGAIHAKTVVLEGPSTALIPTLFRKVFGGSATIRIGRIEAESVELTAVDVEFVHAAAIVLGPGAHVSEVEGKVVQRHATSRVGLESRSPAPHGLSR